MRNLIAVLLSLSPLTLTACVDNFVEVDSQVVAWNHSPDPVQTIIRGVPEGPVIPAFGSESFTITVKVARPSYNDPTGPQTSAQDKKVGAEVAFRNMKTLISTSTYSCYFGAKIFTEISYETSSYDRIGRVECREDYTYYSIQALRSASEH